MLAMWLAENARTRAWGPKEEEGDCVLAKRPNKWGHSDVPAAAGIMSSLAGGLGLAGENAEQQRGPTCRKI